MPKNIMPVLTNGCRAVEHLIEKYGSNRVLQVVQRSEHIFQAQLNDGMYVAAIVDAKGAPVIVELPEV